MNGTSTGQARPRMELPAPSGTTLDHASSCVRTGGLRAPSDADYNQFASGWRTAGDAAVRGSTIEQRACAEWKGGMRSPEGSC